MQKPSLTISMLATPMMIVCALLATDSPISAQHAEATISAQHAEATCSNRTLSGDYIGFNSADVLIGIPGLPQEAQFRTVGVAHFDGKGNFTGVEHTVVNGTPPELDWTANSGTYSVNSNCTGTIVLNTPGSPVPLTIFFAVVKNGREFHGVLNGNAIADTWIKAEESPR